MLSKRIFGALLTTAQKQREAWKHLSHAPAVLETEKTEWAKAVSEAEQIVFYPTSFMVLRYLLNDDIANIALHLRNLSGTGHPILKTIKDLIFRNEMPEWGLIVLLYSKAVGLQGDHPEETKDSMAGVLYNQRILADVTELIRTSFIFHKGISTYDSSMEDISYMRFGNKISLLSGDFTLSKSFYEIARIKNQELNEVISSSLRDLAESEFIGDRNNLNMPLPSKPTGIKKDIEIEGGSGTEITNSDEALGNAKAEWTLRNILGGASVLAKSCHATMILAKYSKDMQRQGYLFGKHLALSWQACIDQKPFINDHIGPFSLVSGPVLFHLEHEPDFYREIIKDCDDMADSKYNAIRNHVLQGPGVKKTKMLQEEHSEAALNILKQFPANEAHIALKNLLTAMG